MSSPALGAVARATPPPRMPSSAPRFLLRTWTLFQPGDPSTDSSKSTSPETAGAAVVATAAPDRAVLQDAGRIRPCFRRLGQPSVGVVGQEALVAFRPVRRQPQIEERLFHRVVPDADL